MNPNLYFFLLFGLLSLSISICDSLLKHNEFGPILNKLITGNEKRIVYNNVNRKRSWVMEEEPGQTTSKPEIHRGKDYAVEL